MCPGIRRNCSLVTGWGWTFIMGWYISSVYVSWAGKWTVMVLSDVESGRRRWRRSKSRHGFFLCCVFSVRQRPPARDTDKFLSAARSSTQIKTAADWPPGHDRCAILSLGSTIQMSNIPIVLNANHWTVGLLNSTWSAEHGTATTRMAVDHGHGCWGPIHIIRPRWHSNSHIRSLTYSALHRTKEVEKPKHSVGTFYTKGRQPYKTT